MCCFNACTTIVPRLFSSNIFHHSSSKHVLTNQSHLLFTPLKPPRSSSASNLNYSSSSSHSVMEEESNLGLLSSSSPSSSVTVEDEYTKEIEVAVKAVQMACLICQKVQDNLIAKGHDKQVLSKGDSSPVTVAGVAGGDKKVERESARRREREGLNGGEVKSRREAVVRGSWSATVGFSGGRGRG